MPWFEVYATDSQLEATTIRDKLRDAAGHVDHATVTRATVPDGLRYLVSVSASSAIHAAVICGSTAAALTPRSIQRAFAKQAARCLAAEAPVTMRAPRDLDEGHPLRAVHCPVTLRDDKQTIVNSFGNIVCCAVGQREAAALVALINAGAAHVPPAIVTRGEQM